MFRLKEIIVILISSLLIAFPYFLSKNLSFILSFVFALIVLFVYFLTEKIAAYYFETASEIKFWEEKRYGFYEKSYFKFGVPYGVILSFILPLISSGYFKWFALTQTELKEKKSRVARKHFFYSYPKLTEWNISLICGIPIISLFFLSIIIKVISNFFPILTILPKISCYFALFNLLPIGNLNGMKILAGSFKFWLFLVCLTFFSLAFVILL
ncbi:MAG: hypothetical protein QW117_01125 [Candidatus Pacearchaeota archaeon]